MFNYNKFRELRRKYNLNQFDVANKLNVSPSAIGMYEQGRRQPDNEMIKKIANLFDVSKYVIYDRMIPSTLHQPFTEEEIKLIWKHVDNNIAKLILINIYTGLRPGEFFKITEVHEDYFITGSKTEAGKDRVIPLHDKIKQMFHFCYNNRVIDECFNQDGLYNREKKLFANLGIKHTPYDCRHTFATLCSRYHLDEHIVKLVMGHHISDLTKRVYTHKLIEELIEEINKIGV